LIIEFFLERRRRRELASATIDPNAKCPACGNYEGSIRCVEVNVAAKNSTNSNRAVMIEDTCKVCGARVYEPTILQADAELIQPANTEE
jgi:hypothetical protein